MKKRIIWSLALVCAMCAFSRIGSAQKQDSVVLFGPTGSHLLEICSEPPVAAGDVVTIERLAKGAWNNGMCVGYIAGINDNEMAQVATGKRGLYCLPPGVDMAQMAKVVRKYLEENPAKLHLPGGILVVSALEQAFPCH